MTDAIERLRAWLPYVDRGDSWHYSRREDLRALLDAYGYEKGIADQYRVYTKRLETVAQGLAEAVQGWIDEEDFPPSRIADGVAALAAWKEYEVHRR